MSYDIAVWEGAAPANDEEALGVYQAMWERYEDTGEAPGERLLNFISDLTSQYPDLTTLPDDMVEDSPWADGPLVDNVLGPFFYFSLISAYAGDVLPFIAAMARKHDLVCFDPQTEALL